MKRADLIEGVLFLPAMALLACAALAGGAAIIWLGGFILEHVLLASLAIGLPKPFAGLLALLVAVACIGLVLPRAISLAAGIFRRS